MLIDNENGVTEYAALLILVGAMVGYYVLMTMIIVCIRHIRGPKHTALVITTRQRLLIFLNRLHILDRIDVMQTFLSLVLCGLYVVETYGITEPWFEPLETVVNVLFGADYLLQFYISRNKLDFLFSLMAFVDVVTLFPILVFKLVFSIDNDTSVVLRVIRVTKLFRILRSFRFLRNRPEDVSREVSMMAFGIFCLIFTSAGFYQLVENHMRVVQNEPAKVPFHEAFYFNAIEILGRPRIEPETAGAHLLLILVVTAAYIIIPWQAASILKALQRDPWAMRTKYKRMSDSHIVIMGHVEFPVLNLLLYEAYHPDRGPARPCDIVILSGHPPDHQIRDLLGHPAYTGHVQYIQGSSQVEKDLLRAKVHEALAVLVLACKYPADPQWEDTQVASIVLSCKAFKNAQLHRQKTFGGRRRLRLLAQVLSPETRDRIVCMPGWDRLHDLCLVIGELTAAMLAGSALHRGMATMVLNLVSHTTSHAYDTSTERWFDLYHRGSRQEIYHCSVPRQSGICGQSILSAAHYLYEHHGMLLIAVKRSRASTGTETPASNFSKQRRSRLMLFPGGEDTFLQDGDRVYVIASSLPEVVVAIKRAKAQQRPVLRKKNQSDLKETTDTAGISQTQIVRKGDGDQHTWEEDSNPDFFTRLKHRSEHWKDLKLPKQFSSRLRRAWWKMRFHSEYFDHKDEDLGSFGFGDSPVHLPRGFNRVELERIQSEEMSIGDRTEGAFEAVLSRQSFHSFTRVSSPFISEALSSKSLPIEPMLTTAPKHRKQLELESTETSRLKRLMALLVEYGGDMVLLEKDLATVGLKGELRPFELTADDQAKLPSTIPTLTRSNTTTLDNLEDHVVVYGGDSTSIAATVRMLQLRQPGVQVVILSMGVHEERTPKLWQELDLDTVYFVKQLLHHQRDLGGPLLYRAKAVIILPLIDKEMANAPVQGWELRRMVDSDTILTTNVLATRKWTGNAAEFQDVWTVTQLFQEGSLNRFFGMNPEAQGATSLFEDRWMASAPLNMSPLFAAGHVIATTTVDRFLMESFFNPDAMIIVERLFGLAGLTIGTKAKGGLGSLSNANFPCVSQLPASSKLLEACRTFGEAANMLLCHHEPMIPLGVFRYPKGNRSSYSMLVSLEAAQELDFRCPQYGFSQSFCAVQGEHGMSNRLPFVVTNPPKDLVLLDSDLLFVLGRPSYHERSSKVATPGDVEEVASEDETSDSDLEEVISKL